MNSEGNLWPTDFIMWDGFFRLREVENFENYGLEILDVWYEIWERECEVRDMELKDGMWEIRWRIWVRNILCGGIRCEIKYMEWGMKMWAVDWICDGGYWILDVGYGGRICDSGK